MKEYFISYHWISKDWPDSKGFGNNILTLEKDRLNGDDIREIENRLCKDKDVLIKIINIQPLPIKNENN